MDASEATHPQTVSDDASLAKRRTRRSSPAWQATEYQPRALVDHHRIDLETLQQHFHLPIVEVAKQLGICTTILKKICRKLGIPRWPYRKLVSLDKHIAHLKEVATHQDPVQEANIQQKMAAAQLAKEEVIAIQHWRKPRKTVKSRRHDRFPYRDVIEPFNEEFDEELAASLRPRSNRSSKRQATYESPTLTLAKPPRVSHLSLLQPLHPDPSHVSTPSNDTSNQLWTVPMTMPQFAHPSSHASMGPPATGHYGFPTTTNAPNDVISTHPIATPFSPYQFQMPNPWALQQIPVPTDESHYQLPFVLPPQTNTYSPYM